MNHDASAGNPPEGDDAVAVIAVHGVSDPAPGEYAALVADQLRRTGHYSDFVRAQVRLRVVPVSAVPPPASYIVTEKIAVTAGAPAEAPGTTPAMEKRGRSPGGYGGWMAEQTPPAIRAALLSGEKEENPSPPLAPAGDDRKTEGIPPPGNCTGLADEISLHTMADQLRGLIVPKGERAHESTVYNGRVFSDGKSRQVDVHELYWGDLSRPGPDILRWLVELYQIIFQVVALGRFALDYARGVHPRSTHLSAVSKLHHTGMVLLTIVIPAANLLLASVCAGFFCGLLAGENWQWISLPAALLASVACYFLIVRSFDQGLPGIAVWFKFGGLALMAVFLLAGKQLVHWLPEAQFGHFDSTGSEYSPLDQLRDAGLCWLAVLYLSWLLVALVLLGVSMLQIFRPSFSKDPAEDGRVRRALWTVIISLLPTSALILLFNLALWAAGFNALKMAGSRLPSEGLPDFNGLLMKAGTLVFPTAVAVSLLIVWAGIAFWPGIRADLRWHEDHEEQQDKSRSQKLGLRMTAALQSVRLAGEVFRSVVLLAWVVLPAVNLIWSPRWLAQWNAWQNTMTYPTLYVLGGFFLLLIVRPGPMAAVATGFRAVLDILLDVVNWLRPYPYNATPRARICARYTSLLRHLCDPGACGKKYSRIVIVAHSYGNMVTSDLFRYLRACAEKGDTEPGLAPLLTSGDIPVYYLAMASPLRQLCGLRFPHQYAWARSEFQPDKLLPAPGTLGLKEWKNFFHAGDYIGRHLWTEPDDKESFAPDSEHPGPNPDAKELCLGTGGHLNYFDPESKKVRDQIHAFITAG